MRSGLVAEFTEPKALLAAGRRVREIGCRRVEVYSPFRIDGLDEALGIRRSRIPVFVLGAALTGIGVAYGVIWLCNAYDYPINVGGRPLNSVPSDVPIMFETAVLFAALTAFVLAILTSGMPRLHDSMSDIEGVERTSIDRFWLTVEDTDPFYDDALVDELRRMGAVVRVVRRAA